MHIAGGFYREQCCRPAWDAMFGSGGRAAITVCTLSPGSSLHTYAEGFDSDALVALKAQGVELQLSQRPTGVVFSYFHPLSRPYIYPAPHEIACQPAITVKGDVVLRFGFLEGDAVVDADRAVFDPQSWRNPIQFGANGSRANVLAIVLNELELRSSTGIADLKQAAQQIIEKQNAEIAVVKRGIWGAMVYERSGVATSIPVYRSSRVFKIGSGDIFSAIFAHYWAEKGLNSADAADIASRSVSAYCSSGRLSASDDELQILEPIKYTSLWPVLIEGSIETLGQRYTMEEARFILRELGVDVFCPALDAFKTYTPKAVLVLADGLDTKTVNNICSSSAGMPIVVLNEDRKQPVEKMIEGNDITVTDDFASSIYFVAWAAAKREG